MSKKFFQIFTNADCNLRCKYCYIKRINKCNNLSDIIDFIDIAITNSYNENVSEIVFEFIGGETFLYIDTLEKSVEYIFDKINKLNYNVSIKLGFTTNGTTIVNKTVQNFLNRYKNYIYLGISIDGIKECHDLNRVDIYGNGSYDRAIEGYFICKNIINLPKLSIHSVISNNTINYISENVKFLLNNEVDDIRLLPNCKEIFNISLFDSIFKQFIDVIDYLDDNNINSKISPITKLLSLDTEFIASNLNDKLCGACDNLLCLGMDKKIYGCATFAAIDSCRIGRIDNKLLIVDRENLIKQIKYNILQYHEDCKLCIFNSLCSFCYADVHICGNSPITHYNRKPYCGFTKALGYSIFFRKYKHYTFKGIS